MVYSMRDGRVSVNLAALVSLFGCCDGIGPFTSLKDATVLKVHLSLSLTLFFFPS